jgi:hypothetical protein
MSAGFRQSSTHDSIRESRLPYRKNNVVRPGDRQQGIRWVTSKIRPPHHSVMPGQISPESEKLNEAILPRVGFPR